MLTLQQLNGLVVNLGYHTTEIVPIIDGKVVGHAVIVL